MKTSQSDTNSTTTATFKLMGTISLANIIFSLLYEAFKHTQITSRAGTQNEHVPVISSKHRCSLCLENCRDISCTPCGHLFCWACIHEALAREGQGSACPSCREMVRPQTVVRVMNYG